jgi:hypothetical protein
VTLENADNSIQGNQSTKDGNTEAAEHPQETKPTSPPLAAKPDTQPSCKHPEITCNTKRDWIDWITLGLEGFGLFVLIVYTMATILMYCANKKAADAAKSAADTASDTLKFSRQQSRFDERPYMSPMPRGANADGQGHLSVYDIGQGPAIGRVRLGVAVEIMNVGKSPAIGVIAPRTEFKVGPWKKARQETIDYKPDYSPGKSGQIVFAGNGITAQSEAKIITTAEWEKLTNGQWEFYVVGGIRYRDMFNPIIEPYETTYCYHVLTMNIMNGGLPFAGCDFLPPAFGNSIK